MNAVLRKALLDVRGRKLHTGIIAFVVALSAGAGTMALSLLIETDAPFDNAFAAQQGAHLSMIFDSSKVTSSQLAATANAPAVAGSAGPWRQVGVNVESGFGRLGGLALTGRADPEGPVDRLSILSGRWASAAAEVVLERHVAADNRLHVGDTVTAVDAPGHPGLQVVGVAVSIGREQGWVIPSEVDALIPAAGSAPASGKSPSLVRLPVEFVMDYRLRSASTHAEVLAAEAQLSGLLPAGSVTGESNWLDLKRSADLLSNVMVPFLLAFSTIAMVASALIIANVVTGIVIAGYRDIGIMKSIGFTPGQVRALLVGETLAPAALGCVVGIPVGTIAAQPFLQDTANALGIPLPFAWSPPIVAGVVAAALGVAALAAGIPARRAARLSAVEAIAAGSSPGAGRSSRFRAAIRRLPLPRVLTLGLGDAFARPVRAGITLLAILFGVATVTLAVGLHGSLSLVKESISRAETVPIEVDLPREPGKDGGLAAPSVAVEDIVGLHPETANVVAVGQTDVQVGGLAHQTLLRGFRGRSSGLGYAVISGRWFESPGEVVVQDAFLQDSGHHVGESFPATTTAGLATLRIVGTYVDNRSESYTMLGDWTTLGGLKPSSSPLWWEVQTRTGVDPAAFAHTIASELEASGYIVDTRGGRGIDESFLLLNIVIAALAVVLTMIAVAGVFNTVLLNTREKVRETAILKSIGMRPGHVVLMVVTAVSVLGVIGGLVGIPAGVAAQHAVLAQMASIAGTGVPDSFYQTIRAAWLPLLAASGLLVAVLGALAPAIWAARTRVVEVLHSE